MKLAELRSFSEEVRDKAPRLAGVAAGGLLGLSAGAGLVLARRPGLAKDVLNSLKSIGRGGARAAERSSALPIGAVENSKRILEQMQAAGLDPASARIAVAAAGGTGKSTLSRALGQEGKLKVTDLDTAKGMRNYLRGRDLRGYLTKNTPQRGNVYEQTHLITQVGAEPFDAVIHLEKPYEEVQKQLMGRGRGAWQRDYYDYPMLQKDIRDAYERAGGENVIIAPGISLRVAPKGGFKNTATSSTPLMYMKKGRIALDAGTALGGAATGGYVGHRLTRKEE